MLNFHIMQIIGEGGCKLYFFRWYFNILSMFLRAGGQIFFFIKFCSICENSTARIRNNRANSGKLKTKLRQGFAFLLYTFFFQITCKNSCKTKSLLANIFVACVLYFSGFHVKKKIHDRYFLCVSSLLRLPDFLLNAHIFRENKNHYMLPQDFESLI